MTKLGESKHVAAIMAELEEMFRGIDINKSLNSFSSLDGPNGTSDKGNCIKKNTVRITVCFMY